MTNYNLPKKSLVLFFLCLYGVLFYFILTYQYRLDFSSLYTACQTLAQGDNPYRVLLTTYLPTVKKLPANLNPPTVLMLFSALSHLQYDKAVAIWSIISFILGLIGATIAFKYAFSATFLKKNGIYLYLLYLSFYATITDTAIAQLGALLLFCIMCGYHFYMKRRDYSAGIFWGLIISIKLFPALLFIYALTQKRYRVCLTTFCMVSFMWLLPLLIYGKQLYTFYFSMMSRVLWYGDSWNASIYGMMFRLFVDVTQPSHRLLPIYILYSIIFCVSLMAYIKKMISIEQKKIIHQSFCLTLIMMLLLSPLGWVYYFPILIFPLTLTWLSANSEKTHTIKSMFLWFICLFLINFPMDYIPSDKMLSVFDTLTIYSFHFYGLLLLLYLATNIKITSNNPVIENYVTNMLLIIFSFDILVIIISFLNRIL